MTQDNGASTSRPGSREPDPQAVPAVPASIPRATPYSFCWGDAESLEARALALVRSMAAVKCKNKYPVGVIGAEARAHYSEARHIEEATGTPKATAVAYWRADQWLAGTGLERLREAVGAIVSMCADSRDVFPDYQTSFEAVAEAVNELYGCVEDGVFTRDSDGNPEGEDAKRLSAQHDSAGPKDIAKKEPS